MAARASRAKRAPKARRPPRTARAAPPALSDATCRDRLGLALAGGGFRAALFHIGVFRRLAELDLLRYVEVLSTVSGGSIVGALYVLLLKRELERVEGRRRLEHPDYLRIVDDLEARLVAGIRKNLRTRLFANPFELLHILVRPQRSLGDRMAALYERHLYADTVKELWRDDRSGPLLLRELMIRPGRKSIQEWNPDFDIDSYNREQVEHGGSAVTKLVMNATSLNTGARFLFKATEIGEWHYGYARSDEAEALAKRKREVDAILREPLARRQAKRNGAPPATLARWVITGEPSHLTVEAKAMIDAWPEPFDIATGRGRGAGLIAVRSVELGLLRQARIPAWHLRKLMARPALTDSGGFTFEEHRRGLAVSLGFITHEYADRVERWLEAPGAPLAELCRVIDEVYLYRSARNIAASVEQDWNEWQLSQAVAASANFPPVFPPLLVFKTYDDITVSRLGLTDGGVYDNLGAVGLINEGCNYIISSDTGLIDKPVQHVSQGYIGMMGRIANITSDSGARHMRNLLVDQHQVSAGLEVAYRDARAGAAPVASAIELVHATRQLQGFIGMRIDSSAVVEMENRKWPRGDGENDPPFDATDVGALRTDLDCFGDIEVNALINQGYANTGLYVKQWLDYAPRPAAEDDRPDHAQRRYARRVCGKYYYAAARASTYRDARKQPLRPIANTTAAGMPDRRDKRAAWVIRAGRARFLRAFRWRWPPDAWLVTAWLTVLAGMAALCGFGARWSITVPSPDFLPYRIDLNTLLATLVAVAAIPLYTRLIKTVVDRLIRRAEDAGRLERARWLASTRRWPAKLVFWLGLATLVLVGAAFLPSAVERTLAQQFATATQSVLFELALVIGLSFLLAAVALLARVDGYLSAASQRLNQTGRPSSQAPGGVRANPDNRTIQ